MAFDFLKNLFSKGDENNQQEQVQEQAQAQEQPQEQPQEQESEDDKSNDTLDDFTLELFVTGESFYQNQAIRLPRFNDENKPTLGNILPQIIGEDAKLVNTATVIDSFVMFRDETSTLDTVEDVLAYNIYDGIHYRNKKGEINPKTGINQVVTAQLIDGRSLVLHIHNTFVAPFVTEYIRLSWCILKGGQEPDQAMGAPSILSTLIAYDLKDATEWIEKYESIKKQAISHTENKEQLSRAETALLDGVYGTIPTDYAFHFAHKLYSEDRYQDAIAHFRLVYERMKLQVDFLPEDPRRAFFDCCAHLANCYFKLGYYKLAQFYGGIVANYKSMYDEAAKAMELLPSVDEAVSETPFEALSLGFVLYHLFGVKPEYVHGLISTTDDGQFTMHAKDENVLDIAASELFKPGATIVLPYGLVQYTEEPRDDKSVLLSDNSIVIRCNTVNDSQSGQLLLVTAMLPPFRAFNYKTTAEEPILVPKSVTFLYDPSSAPSPVGCPIADVIKNGQTLDSKYCYIQSLYEWLRVNSTKTGNEHEDAVNYAASLFNIGICFLELAQFEYAVPALQQAAHMTHDVTMVSGFVDALTSSQDARAMHEISYFAKLEEYPNDPAEVARFRKYLATRMAIAMIDRHQFDQAKQLLNDMKKDPELAQFAQGGLNHIEQLQSSRN